MQNSLWLALGGGRLGHAHSFGDYRLSAVEETLARHDFTLEDLMEAEEVVQEAKYGNSQLVDFLSTPAVVEQLVRYTIAEPPKPDQPTASATTATGSTAQADAGDPVKGGETDASTVAAGADADADADADAGSLPTPIAAASELVLTPSATSASLITESIDENSSSMTEEEAEQQNEVPTQAQQDHADAAAAAASSAVGSTVPTGPVSIAVDLDAHSDSDSLSSSGLSDDDRADADSSNRASLVVYRNVHKRPYIASELLCGEIGSVIDVLVEDDQLLSILFSLLLRPPPLDPSVVSYFRKVLQVLIQRRYTDLVSFCSSHGVLDALLRHLGLYSMLELCFDASTLIALGNGFSLPIDAVAAGTPLLSYDEQQSGLVLKPTSALLDRGVKACVELHFNDGRTITCTPDHRFLGADGEWITAAKMVLEHTEIVAGVEYPALQLPSDAAGSTWSLPLPSLACVLDMADRREEALAFAGLLGYLLCQADAGAGAGAPLTVADRLDAEWVQRDIKLLTGEEAKSNEAMTIDLTDAMTDAINTVGVAGTHGFPSFLLAADCPTAVVQAFLAGLFGGGGQAPSLSWNGDRATGVAEMRWSCKRASAVQAEAATLLTAQLQALFSRVGMADGSIRFDDADQQENVDPNQSVSLVWKLADDATVSFAERIGFRYCGHKQMRLTAAAAYSRLRATVKDADVHESLESFDALKFFIEQRAGDKCDASIAHVLPTFRVRLIARREVAEARQVYDLTVPGTHNFLANALVGHNCIMLGWDSGLMECAAMEGQIEQRWMLAQGLIPKLVRRLHPRYRSMPDVHAHAGRLLVDVVVKCPLAHTSPLVEHLSTTPILQALFAHMFSGCTSSLSNSLSVLIVLVQRFANRRLEQMEQHGHGGNDDHDDDLDPPPTTNEWNQPTDFAVAAAQGGVGDTDEEEQDCGAEKARLQAEAERRKQQGVEEPSIPGPSNDPAVLRLGEPFVSLLPHLPRILQLLQPETTHAGAHANHATAADPATASVSSSSTASAPAPSAPASSSSSSASSSSTSSLAQSSSPSPSPSSPISIPGVLGSPCFGSLRMKVIELCLVLARSRSRHVDSLLASLGVAQLMLRVFFAYPWNNLLHGLVESICTSACEEPESELTRAFFSGRSQPPSESEESPSEPPSSSSSSSTSSGCSGPGLVDAFIGAWSSNASAVAAGGMRRGYMGHLIRTAATVDHLLHSMSRPQRCALLGPPDGDMATRWDRFVADTLAQELATQQTDESAALDSVLGDMGGDEYGMTTSDSHRDLQHHSMDDDEEAEADAEAHTRRDDRGYGAMHRYVADDDDDDDEDEDEHGFEQEDARLAADLDMRGMDGAGATRQQQEQQAARAPSRSSHVNSHGAVLEEAAALAADDADADADARSSPSEL